MKNSLSTELKSTLASKLSLIKSNDELLLLMNELARFVYRTEDKDAFALKQLTYYANPILSASRYTSFEIKKRSGKLRTIHAPNSGLKSILKCLALLFDLTYTPSNAVTGFVGGKSIVDNARQHVNKAFVYNMDLQDFFHSFDRNKVKMGIWRHIFCMNKEQEKLAFFIACLCTHPLLIEDQSRVVLPQGAPTSPILTNILCQTLDRRLSGLAKRFRVHYTRYADDITFSSNKNIFEIKEFQIELKRIIANQQLEINPEKTRLQKRGFRQEVTGVIVNEKLNVQTAYTKQLRMWIYYMEKYGVKHAEAIFRNDYIKQKGHIKNVNNPMYRVISGKLLYLKMVKGDTDSTYQKLKYRFDKFSGKRINVEDLFVIMERKGVLDTIANANDVDTLLYIWENNGIEEAINKYKQNEKSNAEFYL